MRTAAFFVLTAGVIVLAGCSRGTASGSAATESGKTPEEFLKWSMDKYAAMPAFHATSTVTSRTDNKPSAGQVHREISVQGPDRFKVTSSGQVGFVLTTVSDGKNMVEYASQGTDHAMRYPAPAKVGDAATMAMRYPMFGGTLLYQFFGGSSNYANLVDEAKGKPQFGPEEKAPGGEAARVVKFYGKQTFGNVQALIGKETGEVYRIVYDSAAMIERVQKLLDMQIAQTPAGAERDAAQKKRASVPVSLVTEELYTDIKPGATLVSATFDTTPPKGLRVEDARPSGDTPPVPLGKPAPEFKVTSMDGKEVTLASLRGKVVLIDFWATWCGPCVKALPDTEKLAKESVGKNLQVMAVSDEKHDQVAGFMKENHYTMPSFLDTDESAHRLYKTSAIPCTVIIDAKGNLAAYFIGAREESVIRSELAKAGAVL